MNKFPTTSPDMVNSLCFAIRRLCLTGRVKVVLLLLFLSIATSLDAQVYVTPLGAGANNGSSWSNAFSGSQLRGALRSASPGSQFWIAAGTYYPGPVRDSFFYIKSTVKVYGGFNGTETTLAARNWTTNVTILSGDVGVPGDSTDNSIHVVTFDLDRIDSSTLLDGFTITKGNAYPDYGGGVCISSTGATGNGYPVIRHCKFTHNRAQYGGGAVVLRSYGFPNKDVRLTIDSCDFLYNHCDSATNSAGGGLLCLAENGSKNTLFMTNCTFSANKSNSYGGGVELRNSSGKQYATIKKCTFESNVGEYGGALGLITYNDYSFSGGVYNVNIDSCVFDRNAVRGTQGGAIYGEFNYPYIPVVNITNSTFFQNSSPNAGGVALFTRAVNALVTCSNDIFRQNHGTTGNFGAFDVNSTYGGLDTTRFINCLFDRNRGGTLCNRAAENGKSYVEFVNTTIYDDSIIAYTSTPTGIVHSEPYLTPSYPNGWNTTVFKNSILYWGGHVTTPAFMNAPNSTAIITNSLVKGSNGSGTGWNTALGTDGGRNMDVDPQFSDPANGNYNLRCVSPARDTATNSYLAPWMSWPDLNGNSRIYNAIADLGSYEYNAIPPSIAPLITINPGGIIVTVSNLTTGQEDSVSWDFGDGTYSKYYTVTHTYPSAGTYTICLHVFSCLGNADSCVTVTLVNTLGEIASPAPSYTVFPNPTSGELNITGIEQSTEYYLLSLAGSVVQQGQLERGSNQLQMAQLASGMYLLRMRTNDGGSTIVKVVKL